MTEWLDAIMREATGIDLEKFRPMDEIGPRDHVVGEADDDCRGFYALAMQYKRHAAELRRLAMTTPFIESSSKMRYLEEAKKTEKKASVLIDIFQVSVRETLGLWGEDIDIRKGWKIVRVAIEDVLNGARFFEGAPFKARM